MTKTEAIQAAALAQRAGTRTFQEHPSDSPESTAATQAIETAWRQALDLGTTRDDILAALREQPW